MKYVDAGYAIALGALFVYACSLLVRKRRLSSTVRRNEDSSPQTGIQHEVPAGPPLRAGGPGPRRGREQQ